jgi:hypothetical protein
MAATRVLKEPRRHGRIDDVVGVHGARCGFGCSVAAGKCRQRQGQQDDRHDSNRKFFHISYLDVLVVGNQE